MIISEIIHFYCKETDSKGIYHTFPVNSDASKSAHENAKEWTKGYGRNSKVSNIHFKFPNSGFDNVKIVDLDIRAQGGRAYQVHLQHEGKVFKVDMRESTLMDVILNTGIEAGGKLNGTFCFVKDGSQIRLLREGSKEFDMVIAHQEKKDLLNSIKISTKDLLPGYVYDDGTGSEMIYLGRVYANSFDFDLAEMRKPVKYLLFADKSKYRPNIHELLECKTVEEARDFLKKENKDGKTPLVLKSTQNLKIQKGKLVDVDIEKLVSIQNELYANRFKEKFDKLKQQSKSPSITRFSRVKASYWDKKSLWDYYMFSQMTLNKRDLVMDEKIGIEITNL